MLKLVHVINPIADIPVHSDLAIAQPMTLKSLELARAHANKTKRVQVQQFAAAFPEDAAAIPQGITATPFLHSSILDVVSPQPGEPRRKLPLIEEILTHTRDAAGDAKYLVYSNIDIGVQPYFYEQLATIIEGGTHAFTIARRTVSTSITDPANIRQLLQESGQPHFGYCCFVFPVEQISNYHFSNTCIGLQPVGITLVLNMIERNSTFHNFQHEKLTFHIGDDQVWNTSLLTAAHVENERSLDRVTDQLAAGKGLRSESQDLLAGYSRWRSNYVIDSLPRGLRRNALRAVRKLGFGEHVANLYGSV